MLSNSNRFQESLNKRKEEGTLRRLRLQSDGIDFYSNDYLGFAKSKELQHLLLQKITDNPQLLSGSTGSRLISGNNDIAVSVENYIAQMHQFESALLFPSGYKRRDGCDGFSGFSERIQDNPTRSWALPGTFRNLKMSVQLA